MISDKELKNDNNNVENNENNNIEYSNVFEELVSESDTVKLNNESTDELVECSDNEMLMCIDEVERVWKNNVVVEWGQRVNFPINFSEPRCSQMLCLQGKRPVLVEELNCLLMLYNVVPSVCNNDVESMIWYCDERELNREVYVEKVTELYNLNRKYDEWKESLKVYLSNNDCNDLTKVINPIMNVFTDGDVTQIPNVDWFDEYSGKMSEFGCSGYDTQSNHLFVNKNQQCCLKPRLMWDDGG